MKTIVAGGRFFKPLDKHRSWLKRILIELPATVVFSGCASGADQFGEEIAKELNIPIEYFPADWHIYGKSAGHLRNEMMAEKANVCILFPGGRGTANMKKQAYNKNLVIIEYNEIEYPKA